MNLVPLLWPGELTESYCESALLASDAALASAINLDLKHLCCTLSDHVAGKSFNLR